MDDGLKQRFVGAIVLISVAIIFVPMVFDKPNPQYTNMDERVPFKPQPEPFLINAVQQPTLTTQDIKIDELDATKYKRDSDAKDFVVKDVKPSPNTNLAGDLPIEPMAVSQHPEASDNGLPNAWVVRLGAFSKPENALALLKKLRKQGYKAFSRTSKSTEGDLIRVYVGPKLLKQTAESLRDKLKNEFQLNAQVVRFQV